MAVLPIKISALCATSQLPGEGPTDVEDAPAKTDNYDDQQMTKVAASKERINTLYFENTI